MSDSPESIPRAAGNLLGSIAQLGSTLVDYGKTRLTQFGDGVGEEIQRATGIVIWSAVIVMLLGMGLLLAGLTVIVGFWDTPFRLLSAILVTSLFFVIAGVAFLILRNKLKNTSSLLRGVARTALLASVWRRLTR